MVPPPPRLGTFSPSPVQAPQTGTSHSPHPSSQPGGLSAGASPSTSSPIGTSVGKISIAQVYLLLSTIKEHDKDDPTKWDNQLEQLRRLIDDNGMEVFTKYIARLVAGNASQIFGLSRPGGTASNNVHVLISEMRKIATAPDQARKIAESIETGTEEIFRDFDLSTFMEFFKLDPLEKTILALAFKLGNRPDLRTKADAILSTNYATFVSILSQSEGDHGDLGPSFISLILDRFIQEPPPNFNSAPRTELVLKVQARYSPTELPPPSEVLAALDLMRILSDQPANALALYIKRTGPEFTRDHELCVSYLQRRPASVSLGEEQVAAALTYATISQTQRHNPSVLVSALRQVHGNALQWQHVVSYLDQQGSRISSGQFLRLYDALLPIAKENDAFDIQRLWGGNWQNSETQLSFICAFASLRPDQLDATTIPGLQPSFTLEAYEHSPPGVVERVKYAMRHPLVSVAALTAVFHVALVDITASQSPEAKRLFQEVVVPNLDIFVVSAFGAPKPWPDMAVETLNSLFDNFLYKRSPHYEFVLDSLWKRDSEWVSQRLADAHAVKPVDLPLIFEHAVTHKWLNDLVYLVNGFGLDLAALAHAEGYLDLGEWARTISDRGTEVARSLLQFLMIKAELERQFQRSPDAPGQTVKTTTALQVKTVYAFLGILEDLLPKHPVPQLIQVQRSCIIWYPRLINYGEGYDDIIDANGKDGNALPTAANVKMEEHYKKMYSNDVQVRDIVEVLERYKRSRDSMEQDIFACMIHGLFDEYTHFVNYPLDALATTAVLFGGIISHKLISEIPLQIGLGMILEAIRDHKPEDRMFKFGLQALIQLFGRLREWPGFCDQLLQIPDLRGTDAWKKAEEVVRSHEEEMARSRNGGGHDGLTNGNADEGSLAAEQHAAPPFAAINVDPRPAGVPYEDPDEETQGKIQFSLNNTTESTLQTMFVDISQMLGYEHQQWFASHLVEERAKMQPNYHRVYLDLVKLFEDRSLWTEVLRETYISVARMLNSEVTMQNSTERTHLKNLGAWLGLLTLARDKPIKHKNMAIKQLLIEAHDTKRLIVVIPFVCKVLAQGASSIVFRPPNPWLMDIIHLLIELYHNAELKLNLKFEIEVLCKGLNLDHKSIEPSGEILNRVAAVEEAAAVDLLVPGPDGPEPFDNLSLNGMGPVPVGGGLATQTFAPNIPDLTSLLQIPPTNEMVISTARLTDLVHMAINTALRTIIVPVVERSVTIAAISTREMIRKDFCTEPNENRVRDSAMSMVKSAAGSLALVTSREPLKSSFGNTLRQLANDPQQGQSLPEGTIHMCVNLNMDIASGVIQKAAEERAVPEIEELIEPDLEARRRHRATRPNEPFVDPSMSRWAWTIPNPFKLSPNLAGLTPEQMAIYEDFARGTRSTAAPAASTHGASTSDASRSMANEVLQDQFSSVVPTPAETPSIPNVGSQQIQPYAAQAQTQALSASMVNGRQQGSSAVDQRSLLERVQKYLTELQRVAFEAAEEHFADLPRPHQVLDTVDALVQLLIKAQQTSEELTIHAAELISSMLLTSLNENSLAIETFVHVLNTLRKFAGPALNQRVTSYFQQLHGDSLVNAGLITGLIHTDLLNWRNIDNAIAASLKQRDEKGLAVLEHVLDLTVLNDTPLTLYSDFVRSLDEAWAWILQDPDVAGGQRLKAKVLAPPAELPAGLPADELAVLRQEQMEYVFDEWVRLYANPGAPEKFWSIFVQQMHARRIVATGHDVMLFTRFALDRAAEHCDATTHANGTASDAFLPVDALGKLLGLLVRGQGVEDPVSGGGPVQPPRPVFLDSILSLAVMVVNHHIVARGEHFNQRMFFRFFSVLLHETNEIDDLSNAERQEVLLLFAARLSDLGPDIFPAFTYAWVHLISHRHLLPALLRLPGNAGYPAVTGLLTQLLGFVGDNLKQITVPQVVKELYHAALKLLVVLQHDFPDYLAAYYVDLCAAIPPHCTQLTNLVLSAAPSELSGHIPDPLHPGIQMDRLDLESLNEAPPASMEEDPAAILHELGLLGVLNEALMSGPTEATMALVAHAIQPPAGSAAVSKPATRFGQVPVSVDSRVVEAVVGHLGASVAARVRHKEPTFVSGAPDVKIISFLVRELSPEARYYLLMAVVNRLRFPNAQTSFFSQALLETFGTDATDPEELDVKQAIVRVLLERLISFFPQPWGLLVTVVELVKNDKYLLFELPFIKAVPEVAEKFVALVSQARAY